MGNVLKVRLAREFRFQVEPKEATGQRVGLQEREMCGHYSV